MINYFYSAEAAVWQYDKAVRSGDLSAVLACFSFHRAAEVDRHYDAETLQRRFLDEIEEKGLASLLRSAGSHCQYTYRAEHNNTVRICRPAFMPSGDACEEYFMVGLVGDEWRLLERERLVIYQHHPLLGPIKFDRYFWETHRFVPWLGCVAHISIDAAEEERGLRPDECEALEATVNYPHDLRPYIGEEVFKLYNENFYGATFYENDNRGNDMSEIYYAPPVATPAEIWSLIWAPFSIHMARMQSNQEPRNKTPFVPGDFYFSSECSWDPEHGLGMSFNDWKIDDWG